MDWGRSIGEKWAALASRPGAASLSLIVLCLLTYLPGLLRLPAVDRTEIIYAETTRDMVERGSLIDPHYGDAVHQYRPIGVFWAQEASRLAGGEALARDIRIYRLPALITVTLSVLALFWLGRALFGSERALVASALFAVAPLTVLVSQLAIAEGLSLLPATIAMLVLARIYSGSQLNGGGQKSEWPLALLFWGALGFGMLVDALLVPIIVAATLITLFIMDRELDLLKRLKPLAGIPLALIIASPWIIVRAHQDGLPFAGMGWREFLAALGGAQDMKLRAFPGTFVLAVALGFLPGTALLGPALSLIWGNRHERLNRFLFAWIAGYIVYLEALSSKPGTYMVQTLFPALAIAVASVVVSRDGERRPPGWHAISWPVLAGLFALAIFAAPYVWAGQLPTFGNSLLIGAVALLFAASAAFGRKGELKAWAAAGVGALSLFAITLLGGVLPSIDKIWPAREIQRATSQCSGATVGLLGFREPSGRFVLGVPPGEQTADAIAAGIAAKSPRISIIEGRLQFRADASLEARGLPPFPAPSGCVEAYNVMRGCALQFRIFATGGATCEIPAAYACKNASPSQLPRKSADCD